MRLAARAIALLLAWPRVGAAAVPDPLFWATAADFHREVAAGQFLDRLELHLLQYASDASWRFDWAAEQYTGSGIFGQYGSTTSNQLYVDGQIALNVFATDWLQFRYDRREAQDGRFDRSDQRLDAVWHTGLGWGLALSGWPTFEKGRSAIGGGLRFGGAQSRNAVEIRLLDERWIWNERTDSPVRFTHHPFRIALDGSGEWGAWRLRCAVDWGLRYEAREGSAGGAASTRTTRGLQRFADLEALYAGSGWAAAVRLTGAVRERSQADSAGAALSASRAWGRAVLSLRRDLGAWSATALAGWATQRDDHSGPDEPRGRYAADALLVGAEGAWQALPALQLRLGYLGSRERAERSGTSAAPLAPRSERAWLDKAHVRAHYAFRQRAAVELLLSQALSGGRFGGGSVKAILAF